MFAGWGVTNGNQSQTLAVSRIYMARELGQAAHASSESMALGSRSWEYIYVGQERVERFHGHVAREPGQVAFGTWAGELGIWTWANRESIRLDPRRGRRVLKGGCM